ncbi:MAG: transcription-repair coupling factor, partial [Clostridia bacterium]|nr:transcription-repair coupling factor [Clostridia bacterium]
KSKGEFLSAITEKNALYLDNFARSSYETPLDNLDSVSMAVLPAWRGGSEVLREEMRGNTLILVGNEKTGRLLCDDLQKEGKDAVFSESLPETVGAATVTVGTLSAGFRLPSADFTVITHSGIKATKRKSYYKNGKGISSLDELHFGDFVVHAVHGIGIFRGVKSLENNGIVKDYLRLEYAKGDALYVPVTQLDLISKYIGAGDGANIKVNKLGGTAWQSTKARVKGAVRDMAKQLTALYSKRLEIKGHAFSEDTDIQSDFEARFPFEETDDQLRCINEIKADMERPVPMDRLLCGDVGFGKTEVALRAAFKCVSEGKQCALMAPTTILAWQHFNTVKSRFGDFPLETRLLSRFVSKTAQNKTIKELKRGSVDMVIGTHRLISKDIEFRDLGLIIIDEEHRFGVAQKERLKELYPAVDVLTLSATPIPRTLNMAMSGLRDMSSIDEAPEDRLPVQTYVLEQDGGVLLDAINRELRRGGQVYYLHNRVESIVACAARLKAQLPDANIGIAHGKMDEEELSSVWKQLLDGEIDILVCTTIIETGVDVPNANTLIIEDADRMGLSQLHQLRGRVGRSPRRAYAYFCFKRGKGLTEIAEKRLEAIREYTEFGSGFKIALRDLELRGAGSLLGGEQHGHLESVGYDMYIRLLQDAISEEKGEKVQEENNCVIDVNVSAHIPESYIPALPQRLSIYRRIADIKTEEDASDVIDELCDRFGEPPRAVLGLIDVAQIRNRAAECGITEIGQTGKNILLYTQALTEEYTTRLISHYKNRFMLNAGKRPYYSIKLENESVPVCLKEIMSVLCEQDN